jgi:multidrug resistance efflux pump
MKSVYFKRKNTLLRTVNETKPLVKNYNIDRYIYFIFLAVLLLLLGYYLFFKWLYVQADGQVLFENVRIRITDDCRVVQLYKEEGDTVLKGDTLFAYYEDSDEGNNGGGFGSGFSTGAFSGTTYANDMDWIAKEIYNLNKKVSLNKIEINENSVLRKSYEGELERIKNEVILDALPHSRLESVKNEIARLKTNIAKLKQENRELQSLVRQLKEMATTGKKPSKSVNLTFSGGGNGGGGNDDEQKKYFISPLDGLVNRIYVSEFEVALKTEEIMSVQRRKKIMIKAYFEQANVDDIVEGDTMTITFPDGTKGKGYLKRMYLGTYPLPEEFQKRYEPVKRTIAGDIYPADSNEAKKWVLFNKLSVELRKYKY